MQVSAPPSSTTAGWPQQRTRTASGGGQALRVRLNLYTFYLRILTYLAPLFSFFVSMSAALAIQGHHWRNVAFHEYVRFMLVLTATWIFSVERLRLTVVSELLEGFDRVQEVILACGTSYGVALILVFFARLGNYSRIFMATSAVTLVFLSLATRFGARFAIERSQDLCGPHRILIVGSDNFARRTADSITYGPLGPSEIVGYLQLPGQDIGVEKSQVHEFDEFQDLCDIPDFDEVIISISPSEFSNLESIVPVFEQMCVPVRIVLDFGDRILLREKLFQVGRLQLLDLATTPAESLPYLILKRAFDLTFATIAIALTAPLMIAAAIGVKLSSPGPVFFSQERVGLNGSTFRMLKFRTMEVQASTISDTVWTTEEDPRCTRFGSLLRKTSLDELPQFFNVLEGSMSVVGPRPERPYFVGKFRDAYYNYQKRHYLKTGITGWAQVNGYRGDTSIEKRVEYDLYYLENWSLIFDLKIIAMTFVYGLINRHAY